MKSRSNTALALSALAAVGGLVSGFAGWWLMLGGSVASTLGASQGGTVLILGSLMFGLGFASFVVAYGFLMQRHWAWASALVVYSVSIVIDVASVALVGASPLDVAVPVALSAAVLWFLLRPQTRATFGR